MPSKKELDTKAWEWARHTDPGNITQDHVKQAYRLNLKPCPLEKCRRNCKGNPFCLNGIGEREWLEEIDDSRWHDIDDPEEDRRKQNEFVGLKNLGATCYVNSLLQVWFHNPRFRSAIYEWTDPDSAKTPSVGTTASYTASSESGSAFSLQPAESCGSNDTLYQKVEPSDGSAASSGIPSLASALPSGEQSSKETESSKEMSGEDSLESSQRSSSCITHEMLEACMPKSVCGRLQIIFGLLQKSSRSFVDPTPLITSLGIDAGTQQDAQEFSKLFISLLEQTLSRYPDPLVSRVIQDQFSGEYDYVTRCGNCQTCSRRSSQFYELDLNIKGHKELGECIAEFLQEEKLEGDNQYFCNTCNNKHNATRKIQLSSLPPVLNLQLLRFVFDRSSGHKKKLNTYIQFPVILDMSSYLGQPEQSIIYDLFAVLLHHGNSAYRGHYVANIKDHQSGAWYKFNDQEIEKMKGRDLQLGNEDDDCDKSCKKPKATKGFHCSRNSYMLVYHRRGYVAQDDRVEVPPHVMEYVDKDNQSFEEWAQEMTCMKENNIQNGKALQEMVKAVYQRMPVTHEGEFDWISSDWLSKWFQDPDKAGKIKNSKFLCSHKRLDPDKVHDLKCINKRVTDNFYRQFEGGPRLDNTTSCMDCVRLRCRQIRMETRLEEDSKYIAQATKGKQPISSGYWVCKRSLRSWKKLAKREQAEIEHKHEANSDGLTVTQMSSNQDEENNEDDLVFNFDVFCEHNALSIDASHRMVVTEEVWRRLKFYFPHSPEVSTEADKCPLCQQTEMENNETKNLNKVFATDQKAALLDLYHDKNRPSWSNLSSTLNVVNSHFLEEWKRFVREPNKREIISDVNNSVLLCPHGKFMFDPQLIDAEALETMVTLIKPEEWQIMTKHFFCDTEIKITKLVEDTGCASFICEPEVCEGCLQARLEEEHRALLDYTDATIFVRKVIKSALGEQPANADSDKDDPEFTQGPGAKKRKKNAAGNGEVTEASAPSRRSGRHKRVRGEKEVKVSSKQTLRQLKLQLMKEFSCPPMDQHLMVNNKELLADTDTLATLNILPGTTIYLKVDEPAEGISLEDFTHASHPEEGFKGTGLAGF